MILAGCKFGDALGEALGGHGKGGREGFGAALGRLLELYLGGFGRPREWGAGIRRGALMGRREVGHDPRTFWQQFPTRGDPPMAPRPRVATQGRPRHPVTKFLRILFIINSGKERKFSYQRFWLQLWALLGSICN